MYFTLEHRFTIVLIADDVSIPWRIVMPLGGTSRSECLYPKFAQAQALSSLSAGLGARSRTRLTRYRRSDVFLEPVAFRFLVS